MFKWRNKMSITLYQIPGIFCSQEYFELATELKNKINDDEKTLTEESQTIDKINHLKNQYIYYWLMIEGTRINGLISEQQLSYQNNGWFIWLQNYRFTTPYSGQGVDIEFTYWFDKYFDRYFSREYYDVTVFVNEAIANYKEGRYYACLCSLFPVMEYMERRISNFDPSKNFSMKTELQKSNLPQVDNAVKYVNEFETNMNQFLIRHIYAKSTEANDEPDVICRNRIMHGIFTRDYNKTDCLKLFLIIRSMTQILDFIHYYNALEQLNKEITEMERLNENRS